MNTIKSLLVAFVLLFATPLFAADFTDGASFDADPLVTNWTASAVIDGCDIVLSAATNGVTQWTARIGPAGVISDLRSASGQQLLSPPFGTERTDRVIQWTLWDLGMFTTTGSWPVSPLFNITQAGTFDDGAAVRPGNSISPTLRTVLNTSPVRVDVYSRPQDNWSSQNQAVFAGKIACLTRYEVVGPGVLSVRRVLLVGQPAKNGTNENYHEIYLEAWTPVKRSPFTAIAFSASASGVPAWWYRSGFNIPHYQNFPIGVTGGHAIAYTESGYASSTAAAICFGITNALSYTNGVGYPTGSNVLNSMEWNTGIGLLPALHLFTPPARTMFDVRLAVVVGPGLNSTFMNRLYYVNSKLPATRILWPDTTIDGELATIRTNLTTLLDGGNDSALLRASSLGPTLCRPCSE